MKTNDKFGIPSPTYSLIQTYLKTIPGLKWVKLYGSRAMNTYHRASDIDLAYSMQVDSDITGKLLTDLDDLPTPYQFDVTHYDTLDHAELKDHIDRVGIVIYSSDPAEV